MDLLKSELLRLQFRDRGRMVKLDVSRRVVEMSREAFDARSDR